LWFLRWIFEDFLRFLVALRGHEPPAVRTLKFVIAKDLTEK